MPLVLVTVSAALWLYPHRLPVHENSGLTIEAEIAFDATSVSLKIGLPDPAGFRTVTLRASSDHVVESSEPPGLKAQEDEDELVPCSASSCDFPQPTNLIRVEGQYVHVPPDEGPSADFAEFSFLIACPADAVTFATNGAQYVGQLSDVTVSRPVHSSNGPGTEKQYEGDVAVELDQASKFPLLDWNDPKPGVAVTTTVESGRPDVITKELTWDVAVGKSLVIGGSDENVVQSDQSRTFAAGALAGLAGGGVVAITQAWLSASDGPPRSRRRWLPWRRR